MAYYTAVPIDDVTRVGVPRVGGQSVSTNNVTLYFAASNNLTCIDEYSNRKTSLEEGLGEFDNNSNNKTLETKSKQQSLEMNGNRVKDSTDGVKQLAASFQNAIYVETEKAKKGMPPPVKSKTYKRVPPPVKSKPNAGKVDQNQNATNRNSIVDFTGVIKEAEALSESGSEQSPPSTLSRSDRRSESGMSVSSSLTGSRGSLNSEPDGFQREIRESLQRTTSTGSSVEDIDKLPYVTLSQEDLLEQQEREEELLRYKKEQSKTDSLFNDIQGMLDNLNTEIDDLFK